MEKPQQINRFAGLALLASLINAVSTVAFVNAGPAGPIGATIGFAIILGLVVWILRGKSAVGRLVLTVWLAFGVGASLAGLGFSLLGQHPVPSQTSISLLGLLAVLLNLGALASLWSRPATRWLQKDASSA